MAGSRCINLEPAIIFFPFSSIPKYTFPIKTRAKKHTFPIKSMVKNYTFPTKIGVGKHTFPKKAGFLPYKTWILPHKLPFLVKAIFMTNRKGL